LADNDSADRGGNDGVETRGVKMIYDFSAEFRGERRVLEDLRALKILRAVQTGGELKVSRKECVRLPEEGEDFVLRHELEARMVGDSLQTEFIDCFLHLAACVAVARMLRSFDSPLKGECGIGRAVQLREQESELVIGREV